MAWATEEPQEARRLLAWAAQHVASIEQVMNLRDLVQQPEQLALLRRLVWRRDVAAIARWSDMESLLKGLKDTFSKTGADSSAAEPGPVIETEWLQRYPSVFHAVLKSLAQATPRAARIAHDMLGGWYPAADELAVEIGQLKSLLADRAWCQAQSSERIRRMAQRIANLEQRLQSPPTITASAEQELLDKLEERCDRERLESVLAQLQRSLHAHLPLLNIDGLRERLQQTPYDRILPAIQALHPSHQQLAWRALSKSWDNSLRLLDEPANQKFMEQMQRLGLKLDAWFDVDFSLTGTRVGGATYRVAFTRDPLDILMMGYHYGTCLSPDGVNFFSTISNLVDANKRVLYGRTESGQVIGRCLFALTNQGKLQTFHRYRHDETDGFNQIVDRFADGLAQAMGTTRTESGHVPCLVSSSWYDDGCVAVPGGARDKALRLRSLFDDQPEADAYALAMTIYESESEMISSAVAMNDNGVFWEPPAIKSLLPYFAHDKRVPVWLRLELAARLWHYKVDDAAWQVFDGLSNRDILRSMGRVSMRKYMNERYFVNFIVQRDPRLARQLLRRSRPSGVRCDEQETSAERQYARDKINAALK